MNKVFLVVPCSNLSCNPDIIGPILVASPKNQMAAFKTSSYSLVARNFNELFCAALNARKNGITHFCMLHSDIAPHGVGWLDIMLDEMESVNADILSAVVPIKSHQGLTSTAIDESVEGSNPLWRPRRLSMQEIIEKYKETFTVDKLLVNTGLMLVDIRRSWVNEIYFETKDIILRDSSGNFYAENAPEDWMFSRQARLMNASIYATRKIGVTHYGHQGWLNIQQIEGNKNG